MIINKKWFLSLKTIAIIFVIVFIFTWAMYLWIFSLMTSSIATFTSDFLPFIPLPIRLWFFMVILWIMIAMITAFIN